MTFHNVDLHLPIGLPLREAVMVILQDLAIHCALEFYVYVIIILGQKGYFRSLKLILIA